MIKRILVFIFCCIGMVAHAQNHENDIVGKWMSAEKNLEIEVYRQNLDYKAKVIWFYDAKDTITPITQRVDKRNPDVALRNQKLLGLDVLKHLVYDAKQNKWVDGKIYDSTSGRVWDATVWLYHNTLMKVRGFYCFQFLGKTMTFTKI